MEAARRRLQNELENADFSDVQSESLSHIIANLATKVDLQLLTSEMKVLAASLRGDMGSDMSGLRGEMSELRGEMGSMYSRLETQITKESSKTQRLMIGLIIALGAIFSAMDIISHFAQ